MLTLGQLGLVLCAMAGKAQERAEREGGRGNGPLLWSISFILQAGAAKCVELGNESARQ